MLDLKPLNNKINHKKYSDVHANTKYYFPNDMMNNLENSMNNNEWNNRANNIMYNTLQNNWNEDKVKISENVNSMRDFNSYNLKNNILKN